MVKNQTVLLVVAIILSSMAIGGCLSSTGSVKIVIVGASENVNVTARVENSVFNSTYNMIVIGGETQEIVLDDVPKGKYYVMVTYYGELQEKRIITIEPEGVIEEKFVIMEDQI